MKRILATVVLAATTFAGPTLADDIETVRAFYSDILTDPAGTTEERYFEVFSPDVVSIPTPPGGEGAQGMLNTIAFLGQVVPDLEWEPQEIIDLGDGRFVVPQPLPRHTGRPVLRGRSGHRQELRGHVDRHRDGRGRAHHAHLPPRGLDRGHRAIDRRVIEPGSGNLGFAGPCAFPSVLLPESPRQCRIP